MDYTGTFCCMFPTKVPANTEIPKSKKRLT